MRYNIRILSLKKEYRMKCLRFLFMVGIASAILNAAPSGNQAYKNLKNSQSSFTNSFASGTFVSGSTSGKNGARRWYIFNEGSVGGSYTMLGSANYWAVDLGYHAYIRTIESAIGGFNFQAGVELNFPLYLSVSGKSNILTDHRPFETNESTGLAGWGIELPAMIGIEKNGFYIVGLVGYGWLFMKDTYTNALARGAHPTIQTTYDGLIYGGGLGYKVSNVINIGFRYIAGTMTNRKDGTEFDSAAINNSLDTDAMSITRQRGRDLYNIDYQKFMLFVAFIF